MAASAGDAREAPLLEGSGISKYFGAITALNDVSFHLKRGEVLGVVGDNGAGKSTLMKILSGLYAPSEGQLVFEGRPLRFSSPRDARAVGIEMVYQDLALAGNMPIYENIYLGREPGRSSSGLTVVDQKRARDMAAEHLERLKIHVKQRRPERRGAFRRPAPGRGDRPRHRLRCAHRHHGRADGGARHQGGRQGARPHQVAEGPRRQRRS